MKVILSMAMSVDGIVASPSGSEDFLSDCNWDSFSKLVHVHGAFIVGRRTYEAVQQWTDGYNFDSFPDALRVVVSRQLDYAVGPGYQGCSGPLEALSLCRGRGFSSCVVAGGGELNRAFLEAGLVDEIVVNLEPIIAGDGVRMISPGPMVLNRLKILDTTAIGDGIVQLRYGIKP